MNGKRSWSCLKSPMEEVEAEEKKLSQARRVIPVQVNMFRLARRGRGSRATWQPQRTTYGAWN